MKRALIVLVLAGVLGFFGSGSLESATASSDAATVPSATVSAPQGIEGADFLAWLNGQEPLPAASCTTSVRCYSTGQLLSCSGTTCYRFNGCYVVCDGIEYDCPPGGPFACP
ncbi:MAG: hypothetical protein QOH06_1341 [Acidobacteriota bacterium]|jgi:hypothetical protein|nr:hypothetical protein [Acidobacteriota bacterium]